MFNFLQQTSEIPKPKRSYPYLYKGSELKKKKKVNNGEIIVLAVTQQESKNLPILFVRNDRVKIQNLFWLILTKSNENTKTARS